MRAIVSGETAKSKPNNPHEHWQIFAGRGPAEPSKRASGNAATEGGEEKKKIKKLLGWKNMGQKRGECAGRKKTTRYDDKGPLRTDFPTGWLPSLCRSGVVHRRLQVGLDARFNLACERAGGQQVHTRHNAPKCTRLFSPITRSEAQQ